MTPSPTATVTRPSFVPETFRGECKIFPARDALLLGYQRKWVEDDSRLKLMEKGRQIGISWASACRCVMKLGQQDSRLDAWISSRDDLQARLFLEDCKAFGTILNAGLKDLGNQLIDDKGNSAYVLSFANGRRLHSMSSNPDAQAGKRGSRVLDEFALHPDPRKLWNIAYPGITWGGTLELISTHRGTHNPFNELVQEIKHKGNPKGISLHTVTLEDALRDGFLYKLQCKLPPADPRQRMDEADYFAHIRAGCLDEESFLQEFCCAPADDAGAFLTYDQIAACEYALAEDWEGKPLAECSDLYIGVDVGRDHDLTAIWVLERVNGIAFTRKLVELQNTTFEAQEHALYELLSLPNTRRCYIDQTGIGRQFAERAGKRFGWRVEGITFTNSVKEGLAFPLRAAFEARSIRIPNRPQIRSDLRAVRKEPTAAGNIRITADRGKNGHADRFWALALALSAANSAGGNTIFPHQPAYGRGAKANAVMRARRMRSLEG
jgi:phage FluMu gp28-like protein